MTSGLTADFVTLDRINAEGFHVRSPSYLGKMTPNPSPASAITYLRARETAPKRLARPLFAVETHANGSDRRRSFLKRKSWNDVYAPPDSPTAADLPTPSAHNYGEADRAMPPPTAATSTPFSANEKDEEDSAELNEDWDMSATASASSSPWSSSSLSLDNSDNPFAPVTSSSPHRPRTLSPQKSLSPTRQASGDASPPPLRVRTERHLSDPSRLRDLVARNRPGTLSETEFDAAGHDKVFASAWLNDEDVAVGTKCNRLLVVNTRSGRRFEIPNFNGAAGNAVLRGGGGGGGGEDASRGRSGVGSPLAGVSSASSSAPGSGQRSPNLDGARALQLSFFPALWTWMRRPSHPGGATPVAAPTAIATAEASGIATPVVPVAAAVTNSTAFPACSGIHTVTHNPSRSLLAVGSGRPSEPIQIFDLPSISPRAMLSGHTDVVFAADWLSDGILASGSRDGQVLIWNMQTEELDNNQLGACTCRLNSDDSGFCFCSWDVPPVSVPILQPWATCGRSEAASSTNATIGKVRDLKYSNRNGRIAALLPTQGVVRLFDVSHSSSTAAATDLRLRHRSELVCLSLDRTTSSSTDLYLVGSEAHVSVVDPRCAGNCSSGGGTGGASSLFPSAGCTGGGGSTGGVVMVAESVDEGWGVRSLTMDGTGSGIIAIGGGLGRISFFDMRARKHLSWTDTKAASPGPTDELFMDDSARKTSYRSSGSGWLRHDSVYLSHFSSAIVRNAVYSLNYDDAGVRLFAAGGPLQLNLCGSYMGLWN